jgi:hypothetical protein
MVGRSNTRSALPALVLVVAESDGDGVLVAHERPAALEIGDDGGAPAGRQGEIHGGGLALELGLGLVEVGVSVEEEQAEAPASLQSEQAAEHDRAVSAEYHRELAAIDHVADRVGQRDRVGRDCARVEDQRRRVAGAIERRRVDGLGQPGVQALLQAGGEERVG